MDIKNTWGNQDPDEEDYEIEDIEDIDAEIEAFERHLEHRCDMFTCFYCGTGGGI